MLSCQAIYEALCDAGISFFAGVPDSLLRGFCAYVADHHDESAHIIAANEGNAVALGVGHYLATGELGLVYMQNSGQGNAANPLVSLADPDVYSIPLLLLIGWRGRPGAKDEPQHVKQGKITLEFLHTLGIPYRCVPKTLTEAVAAARKAVDSARRTSSPYALVVGSGVFEPYEAVRTVPNSCPLTREDIVKAVLDHLDPQDVVVSTTGKTSRELSEYRVALGQTLERDFLTVGSMGHASQIALGIALAQSSRQVYCLDGDGAFIMHMGTMATIGSKQAENFKHVVINNGAHDSVGGQPTAGFDIDIPAIAKACGYRFADRAEARHELIRKTQQLKRHRGPALLEVLACRGARADLGRPTSTPKENKQAFMRFLQS